MTSHHVIYGLRGQEGSRTLTLSEVCPDSVLDSGYNDNAGATVLPSACFQTPCSSLGVDNTGSSWDGCPWRGCMRCPWPFPFHPLEFPIPFGLKMARPLKVPLRTLGFTCGLDFSLNPQPFPNTVSLLCMPSSCLRPASQQLLLAPPVAT